MPHDKRSQSSGARPKDVNPLPGQPDPGDWSSQVADATANVDTVVSQQLWDVADTMANAQAAVSAAVADAQAAISAAVADAASDMAQYIQPLFPDTSSAQTPSDIAAQGADQTMAAVDAQMSQIGVRPLDPAQQTAPGRTPYRRPPGASGR